MQKTTIGLVRKIDDTASDNDNAAQYEPTEIRNYPSGTLATIYSDNGITQMSNPITSSVNGMVRFYAANGRYSVTFPSGLPSEIDSILLNDPDDDIYVSDYNALSNPILDILNKNNLQKVISGNLSNARSGVATYHDIYGILRDSQANGFRQEKQGFLIEGSGTNLTLHSDDFTKTEWTKQDLTITSSTVEGPDRLSLASTIDDQDSANTGFLNQSSAGITDDSENKTASIYCKAGTSSNFQIELRLSGGTSVTKNLYIKSSNMSVSGGINDGFKIEKLHDGWCRISIKAKNNSTGNTTARILIRPATLTSSLDGSLTGSVNIYRAQVEDYQFTTSSIKTTATPVTRVADNITAPTLNNYTSYEQGDHTTFLKFKALGFNGSSQGIYGARTQTGSSARNYLVLNSNDQLLFRDNSNASASSDAVSEDVEHDVFLIVENAGQSINLDGVKYPVVDTDMSFNLDLDTPFAVGSLSNGSIPFYGHIINFKKWELALSQAQINFIRS